jgi:MFS family permease
MVAGLNTAAMPFLIWFYLAESAPLAIGVYFIAVLFQSSYLGPTFSLIQTLAPLKMRSVWAAITLLVINLIGLGLGPTMVGVFSDLLEPRFGDQSLRYALLIIAAFTPLAIACYLRAAWCMKRDFPMKDTVAA